jgi:4'-phosphopantetheinyl transferase
LGKDLDQAPGAIQLETGRHKKPTMQNGALGNWHYNISHSGDWILIAIARSGVGIDVEKMEDHFDYTGMLKRCFSLPEVRHLQSGFQARDSFYLLWTRKEALLKATGIGLVEHLECIPCMDGAHMVDPGMIGSEEDWTVSSFVLDRRYVCSIACHPHFKGLRLWDANVGVLD